MENYEAQLAQRLREAYGLPDQAPDDAVLKGTDGQVLRARVEFRFHLHQIRVGILGGLVQGGAAFWRKLRREN